MARGDRPLKPARAWLWFSIGLVSLMTGLLIGPRVPAERQDLLCIGNVTLAGPFGFGLNCDSPEFMRLARAPARLLDHHNTRQARPGLIIAAAALERPLSLMLRAGRHGRNVPEAIPRRIAPWSSARDVPAYLAYILLNVVILVLSFHFLLGIVVDGTRAYGAASTSILVSVGLLFVANDVTKAFVWTPHTQLFNILVPVLALYACMRAVAGGLFQTRFAVATGLVAGLGMTAYGAFAIVPAGLLVMGVLGVAGAGSREKQRRSVANIALLLMLSILPGALWYLLVRSTTGEFFRYEFALGEVVWMADAWTKGFDVLARQVLDHMVQLLRLAAPQAVPVFALMAFTCAVAIRRPGGIATAVERVWPVVTCGALISALVLGFYACVGWIEARLAYPMIPSLLVAAGAVAVAVAQQLDGRGRRFMAAGCSIIAVAQMIFVILKDGPWS